MLQGRGIVPVPALSPPPVRKRGGADGKIVPGRSQVNPGRGTRSY